MTALTALPEIDALAAAALRRAGIGSIERLLKEGASAAARHDIALVGGLAEEQILKWVRLADLCRIRGVGGDYAALLAAAWIDSVPKLARQDPPALRAAMHQANLGRGLPAGILPSVFSVHHWVAQARTLPRLVDL